MRTILAAIALWAVPAFGALAADPSPLRGLMTADDTRGFEAVGRVDLGPGSFCTGTLVAPDLVLTAGHCLFVADTRERRDVASMQFLAGLRDGRALAYRGVRRAILHPDYEYVGNEGSSTRVINDLALLELDRPIRNGSVQPIGTGKRPRKGDEVGVVSYAFDRAARPSLQEACQVLARPSRMLVISCTVDFGSSGAPILSFKGGEPRIVSVVSAKAEAMGQPVSLGTDLESPLETLMELARGGSGPSEPVVRRIGAAGSNAKFLRP